MTSFWGWIFFTLSLILSVQAQAEAPGATCLTPLEIRAVVDDFKIQAATILGTFPLPVEVAYVDVPALADEHVGGYTDLMSQDHYAAIHLSGQQCDGFVREDEVRLLLCHELGHIAGGAPYMTFLGHEKDVVSAEGQADFFATSSCLPALFSGEDNSVYLAHAAQEPELDQLCAKGSGSERGLCMRVIMASLNFSRFVNRIPKDVPAYSAGSAGGPMPTLLGQDPRVVTQSLTRQYPSPQCRLQTMIAGFQCQAQTPLSNFSQSPETALQCGETAAQARRPSCWYKD